ncbi:MAG: MFS transporter [Candidatus Omnitrophica bacterium]|nr:MFS transporter [Candidatus Omnitrophota bacterium]
MIATVKRNSQIISWAMYDTANQFFVLNIVSLYFVRWLILEKHTPEIFYGIAFGISTFFIALLAPIFGTVADVRGKHRPFLIFFTLLCIFFTILLGFTNDVFFALVFFGIANIGCQVATIFYNALMLNISSPGKVGLVSGLGKMFGYFGAVIALLCTKPIVLTHGYQASFLWTGILFLLFSLPCMLFVKDRVIPLAQQKKICVNQPQVIEIFKRMYITLFKKDEYAALREFLKAAFFGLCVVNVTMLFMSIYVTKVFGLNDAEVFKFVILGTVFAVIGSISSGLISDRIGCKRAMIWVFSLWTICLFVAALVVPPYHWIIVFLAGISLGSTWVVSRAFVVNIVPEGAAGEAFGMFNFICYLAGIVGPIIWGVLLLVFSRFEALGYRIALLCFVPLLIAGFVFLLRIPEPIETNKQIIGE